MKIISGSGLVPAHLKGLVLLTYTCVRLVLFCVIDADRYSNPGPGFTFRLLQKKILVSALSCSGGAAIIHAHRHIHEMGLEQNGVTFLTGRNEWRG